MKRLELDINDAMAMIEDFRDRALTAEYELRKLKRAIKAWSPKQVAISMIDAEKAGVILYAYAEFPREKAFVVAQKLGHGKIETGLAE